MNLEKKRKQLFELIGKEVNIDIVNIPDSNDVCLKVYFTNLGLTIVNLNLESELKDGSLEDELVDIIRKWFSLPNMIEWTQKVAKVRFTDKTVFYGKTYVNGNLITADCINNEPYMLSPDCKKCNIEVWSTRLKRI